MATTLREIRKRFPGGDGTPVLLEVDLSRGLQDAPPSDPVAALRAMQTPALDDVTSGLRRAAKDDRVVAVLVLFGKPLTMYEAAELGAALRQVSASGTRTIAWAESYGELIPATWDYYAATHCDEIWVQPTGDVSATGLTLQITLLGGLVDKADAEAQFAQRYEYKSAGETFTRTEPSQPNREMMTRIGDSVRDTVASQVCAARGLTAESYTQVVESGPVDSGRAEATGLVDRLGYRHDLYADLRDRFGDDGDLTLQFAHRYQKARANRPAEQLRNRTKKTVAVVPIRGTIVSGVSTPAGPGGARAGSTTVVRALEAAARDDDVAAVVLHVDSPGGSYIASDAIRAAVLHARGEGLPVVASMGGLAASGGYFVSMGCDRIVAHPTTLTGSVGVVGGKFVLAETLARFGVNRTLIETAPAAGLFSSARPFTEAEWDLINTWLDRVYDDFTRKAAGDRDLPYAEFEPNARGRVWTGADALERSMVDTLGGLHDAIAAAAELASFEREQVRARPYPHVTPLQRLMPAESSESPAAAAAVPLVPLGPSGAVGNGGWLEAVFARLGAGDVWAAMRTWDTRGPGVLALPWAIDVR